MQHSENYQGFEIAYDEDGNEWQIRNKDFELPVEFKKQRVSLKAAKAAIDKFLKEEKEDVKFTLVDGIMFAGWRNDNIATCTITSKTKDGRYWITSDKGERSKEKDVWPATESNLAGFGKITAERVRIAEETQKSEALVREIFSSLTKA